MKRDTRTAYRARAAATERMVDEAKAELAADRAREWAAIQERIRERQANRNHYTAADLVNARAVRNDIGWHKVVRVNGKSVTVETAYSWTDRIPVGKVMEFRE